MGTTAWGGLRERRMLALQVLVLVLAPLASSQPAPTSCCETKTVGGVSYTFVREDSAALGYSCLSPCVYERDDQPGTAFCFAQGDQQVVCGDSPGLEGGEDDIEATVKSLIDAGTCDGVTYATDATTDDCGDAATSYYKEFLYNGKRVIVSNNIPDHPAEQDALAPNPNIRCAGWQFVQLEVDPLVGNEPSVTDTGLGTIGLAVTGGAFFNHLSNPDGSLAMPNEGPSLDSCLGHSAPIMGGAGGAPGGAGGPSGGGPPGAGGPPGGGAPGGGPPGGRFQRQTDEEDVPHGGIYHYHGNLNCSDAGAASGANDPDMCVLLGYYLDGVPVYGLCKDQSNNKMMTSCYSLNAGAATSSITTVFGTYNNLGGNQNDYTYASNLECNLDEASGALHPTTGKYSYFMTTDYPWIPIKFMASRSTICGFTP